MRSDRQDERNRKDKIPSRRCRRILAAAEKDGKPTDRYAALWVERTGDDDARLFVAASTAELDEGSGTTEGGEADPPDPACLAASGWQARYCGVWGRPHGNHRHG